MLGVFNFIRLTETMWNLIDKFFPITILINNEYHQYKFHILKTFWNTYLLVTFRKHRYAFDGFVYIYLEIIFQGLFSWKPICLCSQLYVCLFVFWFSSIFVLVYAVLEYLSVWLLQCFILFKRVPVIRFGLRWNGWLWCFTFRRKKQI